MRQFSIALLAIFAATLLPAPASAKAKLADKVYIYGFVANFTDSVVYFTDIQEVDSVWYDDKTKFVMSRSSYANQLRDYFTNTLSMPHRTCVAVFSLTRKDAEKKYLKLKRQYTVKHAGQYEVRSLSENEFHFEPAYVDATDLQQPKADKKKAKKDKKAKMDDKKAPRNDGRRPPRDGQNPPPRR